jgi:hypothetical protein
MKLTKEQLEAIRQRAENAAAGPWDIFEGGYVVQGDGMILGNPVAKCKNDEDATFIAHARTDIPALLDHIAELEAELARLKDAMIHIDDLSDEFFNVEVIDDTPTYVLKEDLEKYSDTIHEITAVAYRAAYGLPIFIEKEDDQ